jgi:colicin import membrane protein
MQSPLSPIGRRSRVPVKSSDRAANLEADILHLGAQRAEESAQLNREIALRVAASENCARALADRDAAELSVKRMKETLARVEAERAAAVAALAMTESGLSAAKKAGRELALALDRAKKAGSDAIAAHDAVVDDLKKMASLASAARSVATSASAMAGAAVKEADAAKGQVSRLRHLLRRAHEDARSQGLNLAVPRELDDE